MSESHGSNWPHPDWGCWLFAIVLSVCMVKGCELILQNDVERARISADGARAVKK